MHDGSDARAVGRTGLGAVMGSKKLKAVVVSGNKKSRLLTLEVKNSIKELVPTMVQNLGMKQHGTAVGTVATERIGIFLSKLGRLGMGQGGEHFRSAHDRDNTDRKIFLWKLCNRLRQGSGD